MGAATTRAVPVATAAAVVGLDCVWLYMLLHVAGQGLGLAVPVLTLFIVLAASLVWMLILRGLARWWRLLRPSWVQATLSWIIWPAAAFLLLLGLFGSPSGMVDSIEETLFIALASAVLWAFGARMAGGGWTHRRVLIEFQFGLVMLAIAFFIGYAVDADLLVAVPAAVGFVSLGLLATAMTGGGRQVDGSADADEVTAGDAAAGGGGGRRLAAPDGRTGLGGAWWGMLLIGLVLVLVLGIVAGLIFTPELMQYVGRGFRALWGAIDRLLGAIGGLFSSSSDSGLPPPPEVEAPLPPDSDGGIILALPEWMRRPANIAYAVILSVLVLAAIWSVASQLLAKMRRRSAEGVQMESLRGAFRRDLVAALRKIFGWIGRLVGSFRRRLEARDEDPQTASIRRLYTDLQRWGAAAGFPRDPSQTPFEYQETLCSALPSQAAEVRSITESYVSTHYGARPPTDAELRALRESRGRLKRGRAAGRVARRSAR